MMILCDAPFTMLLVSALGRRASGTGSGRSYNSETKMSIAEAMDAGVDVFDARAQRSGPAFIEFLRKMIYEKTKLTSAQAK